MVDKGQHPNVKQLLRIWKAFNENDIEAIDQYVHEDIIYRVSGRGLISGTYRGRYDFIQALNMVKELTDDTMAVKPIITLANDEYVFMLARATGERGQKSLDIEHCYLYRFKDGQLVEGRTMPIGSYEFDEFWS